MFHKMKRHSFCIILPWILLCFAAAALLFGLVTQDKALTLLKGPELLDAVAEPELNGAYVTFDKSRLVAVYASASTTDSEDNETITSYYYILRYGENRYLTLISTEKQYSEFSDALDQSESYYTDGLGTLSSMGSITGFVETIDADLPETMAEQLQSVAKSFPDTGLPGLADGEDVAEYILPYAVRMNRCGWMPYWFIWLCTALWLVLLAIGILLLALQISGWYYRQVRNLMSADGAHTSEQLQSDYDSAMVFDSIRLGDLYTWYYKGGHAYAFPTKEIAWVYKSMYARASDKYRWGITVYLKDYTKYEMYMSQDADRDRIIRAYQNKGLIFLSTYQSSYERLFRDDYPAFCRLAEQEKEEREHKAREKALWEKID